VGYLHFGQVRGEDDFSTLVDDCSLYEHSRVDLLEKEYLSMTVFKSDKLLMISEIFQMIATKILRERIIELKNANPTYYLKRYIEENYNKEIDISSAAAFIGRSTSFVTHKFKNEYNMTFRAYLNMKRMKKAQELLKTHSISDTAEICGFKNRYHFSKVFKRVLNVTPHEYQLTITKE
jgi:AraC-like DNA-binding protein